MGKAQQYSKSHSKTGLIKAFSKWLKAHILTVLYIITFIAIVAICVSLYYENEKERLVALCVCIALLFFTGTTSLTKCSSKSLIGFYRDCWEWTKAHIITIVFAISLVFVFLYFEKEIVEASFSFIGKTKESTFGIVLLWILWIVLLGTMIYSIIYKTKNKTLSDGRTFFVSLLLCSLFVHCWTQYPWETMIDPETKNPIEGYGWAFVVLFSVFALCFIVLPFFLYSKVKHETELYNRLSKSRQKDSFLSDAPITDKNEDKLHFRNHILALKERIEEMPNTGTHSIAITGGWGTGKTSFLNLLQQELLAEKQYEIMWFNPLKSSKSGNIQNDFFDVLESSLSKYKMGFGRRIKYYKELIGAIDNKYVSFLVKLGSIQLEDEKKRINDVIRMIPKKLIIIIDDVDRLNGDEIMQVFRLIGFNAEFENVVFLIPLDKANVVKALGCDPNYPDKFFEMEFPLPDNNRNATSLYIKKALQRLVPHIDMGFLEDPTITEYTTYCISNLRDANRFINSFLDRVQMIYDKLDVCSFYLLSLIRYKSPALYEQIKRKECLETIKDSSNEIIFVVKKGSGSIDHILNKMLLRLFQNEPTSKQGHYIFQPKYFDDYFNETSTKSITDAKLRRLLLSESDEELQQAIKEYTNDDISRQNLIDLWKSPNPWSYAKSLFDENGEKTITNYFRVGDHLKTSNHLSYSDGLAVVSLSGKKFAYIDEQRSVALIVEYDLAYSFSDGLAHVEKDGKFGYIGKGGNVVVPLDYDWAYSFSEGLARVRKDFKFGYIDKGGNVVVPLEYSWANSFSEGFACVRKDGKCGFIDKEGNVVIPLEYDYANSFYEGLALVVKDCKRGFIDKEGNVIVSLENNLCNNFFEGLAPVEKYRKWGFIDKKGNVVVPLDYDMDDSFSEGLARVRKDGKWGFIDNKGNVVVPLEYNEAYLFSEGLARVRKDGKWGFIDKEGNVVVPLVYDWAGSFSEGLACVLKDGKWGFIDKEGTIVVPLDYDSVHSFSESLAPIEKDGKWGFIDKEGNVVVPLEYNEAYLFSEGLARVRKDGKWGFIDRTGSLIPDKERFI